MTLASRGEHTKHPKVIYEKAKAINIASYTDLQLNVDVENMVVNYQRIS